MKTGYFQYIWLLIWNNWIKNSLIYKILRGIYGFISSKWKTSFFASWFRRVDADIEDKSRAGRLFGAGFRIISRLSLKNEAFTRAKENSAIVSICKYLLHNFIALNLRFIGILASSACLVYAIFGGFNLFAAALALAFALISVFDVNLTDYLKASFASRIAESLLGTELTYKFYYMTKCSKSKMRYVCAVLFGVLAGAVAVVLSPLYGAALVLGIVFFGLVMYKTEFGVFAAVFAAPFIPTMALAALCALCAFSLLVKALTSKSFKWSFGIVGLFVVLMICVYFIAALNSFSKGKSLQIWAVYAVMMSFFFVVINTIKSKKQLFDLCRAFVISGFFVCLYGVYQYVFGVSGANAWLDEEMFEGISMRVYSTLENPNVLGEYILLVLPICIALLWRAEKPISKLFYLVLAAVCFGTLILTFSRGCWIAIMVAAAIYVTFVCGKLWGLVLLALPILPFVIPETIISRFASVGNMSDSSTSYRVYIWMGTLLMMKDFWISGIGIGEEAFKSVYPFYSYSAIVAPHSHNMFLQVWVETGIGGIAVFLLTLLMWFKQLCRGHEVALDKALKTLLVGIAAAVCAFMVQGMFDNCFYNYRVFMLFWFVLALGVAAVNAAKSESAERTEKI